MGQREYARHRGVNVSAVQKAMRDRIRPAVVDGKIDAERADELWEKNTDPAMQRKDPPAAASPVDPACRTPESGDAPPVIPDFNESRARIAYYEAEMARIAHEEKVLTLVNAAAVNRLAHDEGRMIRDAILRVPERVQYDLAAMTDPSEIRRRLESELRDALETLTLDYTSRHRLGDAAPASVH